MEKRGLTILGIADLRKKGQNSKLIHNNYQLIWSGTGGNERAKHGVGFILHPSQSKLLIDTAQLSERMVSIKLKDGNETTTYIQIYAPCNDSYSEEDRLSFFDDLSTYVDSIKNNENIVIMGDFNGRVGPRRTPWERQLGPHSDHETKCNSNGEMLLNLCAEQNLVVANTLFQHRKSQVKTWYKWNNLDQSSQIDFILVKDQKRRTILDSWALPHYVIDTDHRPVVIKRRMTKITMKPKTKPTKVTNLRKTEEPDIQKKIQEDMENEFAKLPHDKSSIEEEWEKFKKATSSVLSTNCGTKRTGQTKRKGTIWWNDEVKEAASVKKKCFKAWRRSKTEHDYIEYRKARREAKRIIKRSKDNSWKNYGEKLTILCKENPRDFAKSVRSMRVRDEPFNPTLVINDDKGKPIFDPSMAKERWKNYFKELLNPTGGNDQQHSYIPTEPTEKGCQILLSEVERAIRDSPKNKAPGLDGITTDTVKAMGNVGAKWLQRIFNIAWENMKVPEDWQKAIVVPIWKKKGNKRDCGTYRGISLLSHAGKMYAKILEKRLRPSVEPQLSHCQFGFRKNKGCTDAIFTLRQLCETAIEYGREKCFVEDTGKIWHRKATAEKHHGIL